MSIRSESESERKIENQSTEMNGRSCRPEPLWAIILTTYVGLALATFVKLDGLVLATTRPSTTIRDTCGGKLNALFRVKAGNHIEELAAKCVDNATLFQWTTRRQALHRAIPFSLTTAAICTIPAASAMDPQTLQLCQNGALMPEQSIQGAYEQVCMQLPRREVPIQIPNLTSYSAGPTYQTLYLQQGIAGAGTTGLAVWNSSLLLARLLQQLALLRGQDVGDTFWSKNGSIQNVLELGCGTGLASLTAALTLRPKQVLATDGNPSVVALAHQNIRSNNLSETVQAQVLSWGSFDIFDIADTVDLVFGSDLTYQSQNWPALAQTMATVLKPGTGRVLYLTTGHAGFAVQAEVSGFLAVAQQYGLVLCSAPDLSFTRLVYENCIETEAERAIVESTGGVRVLQLERKRPNGGRRSLS